MEFVGPVLHKQCNTCLTQKTLEEYHKSYKHRYGRCSVCKICSLAKHKLYYKSNADKIKSKVNEYRLSNIDTIKTKKQKYHEDNKEKIQVKVKQWVLENKDKERVTRRKREKERWHTDANFKLAKLLRSRIRNAVRNKFKAGSAIQDLGCSVVELKQHLESQFQPGMTFANTHIDHIKPLASFDLTDREQFLQACHYTNLQPLWPIDNIRKGAKLDFTINA